MDIFFVISGFLITGVLLRQVESDGTVQIVSFYARRARRLLPAAGLVLLVIAVATSRWAPPLQRSAFEMNVAAAGTFIVNWLYAARAVDYWARDLGRSPVLHFWSLSVEEQFYFVWPSLIWLSAVVARRTDRSLRSLLATILAAVVVISLAWWLVFTWMNPNGTFFATGARLWELGLGASLEVARPKISRARRTGWWSAVGIALIVLSAMWIDASAGWRALCPTLGTALVLAGGMTRETTIVSRALSLRPLVWLGGLSYSIYLWHWPVLVVMQDWLHLHDGRGWGAIFALASLIPAWLSYELLERPIRSATSLVDRPGLAVSVGGNLALATVVLGLFFAVKTTVLAAAVEPEPPALGAAALGAHPRESEAGIPRKEYARITPSPASAAADRTRGHAAACLAPAMTEKPTWCEIGDPLGSRRAVLVGDSKIFQYFDVIDEAARGLGLRISTATKAGCPFSAAVPVYSGKPVAGCTAFNEELLKQLRVMKPDMLITSQLDNSGILPNHTLPNTDDMVEGLVDRWSEVHTWGTKIVVILDNPSPTGVGPIESCLLQNWNDSSKCAFDRTRGIAESAAPAQQAAAVRVPGTYVLDLTDYICPRDRCPPVIGDVLIYRQGTHVTATYAQTLLPVFMTKLQLALEN